MLTLAHSIRAMVADGVEKIRAINRRYANPRIAMSGGARVALLALRIYLLALVALLAYRFITTVAG